MRASLIVTAAGSGTRFAQSSSKAQAESKLMLELGGVPVLEKTLRAFSGISEIQDTFVTVPAGSKNDLQKWGKSRGLKKISWVEGGSTRAASVFNALKKTSPENPWVMVHDGARPLIQPQTVKQLLHRAADYDGILLARRVVPTLKKISATGNQVEGTVDRSRLAEAETPQVIRREILLNAYESVPDALKFTDESSLVEAAGGKMGLFLHTDWNPKLTHYADYELAQAKLAVGGEMRVGKGYDIHRLVVGRKLWIGGLKVPFQKGSLGHSDGDALLHCITDAILGALGLGDLGDWFSDKNPKYKNIASSKLLLQVLAKANELGWQVVQVDTNVILEKPKLGPLKMKIRKSISDLMEISLDKISVKARTYETLPPFGTGEAWAAEAIVMLRKKI